MVQLLNSPQKEIPIVEDPILGGFAKIGQAIAQKIGQNQTVRQQMAQKSTEQMQKLIPELIKGGATNQEAVAAATKMVSGVKKQGK